jgi:hypothetical protein
MSPQEQEALFKSMKESHPQWHPQFISGYVDGAQDEDRRSEPNSVHVHQAHDLRIYSLGYLTGFAIHRGVDCEIEPWFSFISLMVQDAKDA